MGEITRNMMNSLREIISGETGGKEAVDKLFNQEQLLDRMQEEVITFLTNLLSQELVSSITREAQEQLRRADEYESVSDYIVSILKLHLRLETLFGPGAGRGENVLEFHDVVDEYFNMVFKAHCKRDVNIHIKANPAVMQ